MLQQLIQKQKEALDNEDYQLASDLEQQITFLTQQQ